jgi:hypothetical protein
MIHCFIIAWSALNPFTSYGRKRAVWWKEQSLQNTLIRIKERYKTRRGKDQEQDGGDLARRGLSPISCMTTGSFMYRKRKRHAESCEERRPMGCLTRATWESLPWDSFDDEL